MVEANKEAVVLSSLRYMRVISDVQPEPDSHDTYFYSNAHSMSLSGVIDTCQ